MDSAHIDELVRDWNSAPPDIFIFQTGVGTRALFTATNSLGLTDVLLRLLDSAQVVVRGPKPTTVLHSRKVRIDPAASDPFTTREVLAEMHGTPLRGKRVVVRRYGETNRELQAELESEGADVTEIVTYRWALPEDFALLRRLIGALGRDEIDLVAFTSASRASNLLIVAQFDGKEESLKQSLGRTLVASIGPVCSVALRKLAVRVDIEAKPPKLGPFVEAINAALSDPRRSFDAVQQVAQTARSWPRGSKEDLHQGDLLSKKIERIRWRQWHGRAQGALDLIDEILEELKTPKRQI